MIDARHRRSQRPIRSRLQQVLADGSHSRHARRVAGELDPSAIGQIVIEVELGPEA
jgi:hypothetical protein